MNLTIFGFIIGCIFSLIVFAIFDKFSCIWSKWKTVRISRDVWFPAQWIEVQRRECIDCGKSQRRTIIS